MKVSMERRRLTAKAFREMDYRSLTMAGLACGSHVKAALGVIAAGVGLNIDDERDVMHLFDRLADFMDGGSDEVNDDGDR